MWCLAPLCMPGSCPSARSPGSSVASSRRRLTTAGLRTPVPSQVWHKDWVTHCQPAGTGTAVLASFAPYIYRHCPHQQPPGNARRRARHVPLPRSASGAGWKRLTLPAEAFIRRASSSMLPRGFSQSPLYGLLSPSQSQSAPADQDALAASLPQQRPWLRRTPHPGTVHQTCPVPSSNGAAGHVVGHWLFLVRLSPHARSRHRAREEGAHRPGLASRGTWRSTRRARRRRHRLGDRSSPAPAHTPSRGLVLSPPTPHGPMPCCKAAALRGRDPLLPTWALHARTASLRQQPPLRPIETPKSPAPPRPCSAQDCVAAVAPHESLIRCAAFNFWLTQLIQM